MNVVYMASTSVYLNFLIFRNLCHMHLIDQMDGQNFFLLMVNGQIENVKFPKVEEIYCKYSFVSGSDWIVVSGIEEGISQMAKGRLGEEQLFVFNFPLDITYKSTNPYGWPQLVICIYGLDSFGNDIVCGYGSTHIPATFGRSLQTIPFFVPDSSSLLQKFTSWLMGCRPEYVDQKIVSQGEGREVSRVCSCGHVQVSFNIAMKNFSDMGYDIC